MGQPGLGILMDQDQEKSSLECRKGQELLANSFHDISISYPLATDIISNGSVCWIRLISPEEEKSGEVSYNFQCVHVHKSLGSFAKWPRVLSALRKGTHLL